MNMSTREQYNPAFLPTQLKDALQRGGINPNVSHLVTVSGRARTVSPLGHEKRSMAAAIDHALLTCDWDDAGSILKMMDADPDVLAQRKKFVRNNKDGVSMDDLIGKVNGHIKYYLGENFPRHFQKVFGSGKPQREALLKIRRSLNVWVTTIWKPTLKTYRAALDAACVAAAHNVDLAFGDTPPPSTGVVGDQASSYAIPSSGDATQVEAAPKKSVVRRKKAAAPALSADAEAGTENLAGTELTDAPTAQ
jgi:hypothetical protein